MFKSVKLSFVLIIVLLFGAAPVQAALSDIGITSRADWGADEDYLLYRETPDTSTSDSSPAWSLRRKKCEALQAKYPAEFQSDGRRIDTNAANQRLYWTRTYSSEIKKIIIHETDSDNSKDYVGNDGEFTVEDARVVVRGIYRSHAINRGWGDIGYHYLIDPFGNIYEGRSGGERVIGAHVYCANTGTIGISFIGHFKDAPPTTDAQQAAVELIGELSNLYDLNPNGFSTWHGKNTRNLVGHHDYGASADPPPPLYDIIPQLAAAAADYARGNKTVDQDYSYIMTANNSPIRLDPLTKDVLTITLKNNGRKAWPAETVLRVARGSRGQNRLGAMLAEGGDTIATLDRRVSPGQSVTLEVPVAAKMKAGRYRFSVTPDFAGSSGKRFFLVVNVAPPVLNYEFVSAKHPPEPFVPEQTAVAWVQLKNTGNFTWRAHGENRVYLAALPTGGGEAFVSSGDELAALDVDVAPGQAARFVMNLTAPKRGKRYYIKFAPKVANFGTLPDYGMQFHTSVREPRFASTTLKKSTGRDLYFQPGETKELFVELKNLSQLTWTPEDFELTVVRGGGEVQLDSSVAVLSSEVLQGETVRVPLMVTAPYKGGKFAFAVRPRWTAGRVKTASVIDFKLTVAKPKLAAKLVEYPKRVELAAGTAATVTVTYKNTGNITWRNAGDNLVKLGTYRPYDRTSAVQNASWVAPTRPAVLTESKVSPGELGHFTFKITKRSGGRDDEWFAPVVEGVGWIAQMPVRIMVLEGVNKEQSVASEQSQAVLTTTDSTDSSSVAIAAPLAASVLSAGNQIEADQTLKNSPVIRVRLSFDSKHVEIGGGPLILQSLAGRELFRGTLLDFDAYKLTEGEAYRVVPVGSTILEISNWVHTPGWSDSINDNRYRGILEVRKYNDELIVVNELPIEDYIRGVAEPLPSDPWEKAKLLAVLARSYALYYTDPAHRKFSGAPYDGSDNPAEFQRYLGYSYELRGQMSAAAEATVGLVATYDGEVVKTPYFTSSGGQTKTAAEAHWNINDFKFTKSVSDPWSCGLNSNAIGTSFACPEQAAGHGVGVSGKGAAGLAQAGKTYKEIIDYFFDGLEVQKVY